MFIISLIILIIFGPNTHVWNISNSDNDPNFYDQIWAYLIHTFNTANCSDNPSQRLFQSLEDGCSNESDSIDWIRFNNHLNNHELSIQSLLMKLNYPFKCFFAVYWILNVVCEELSESMKTNDFKISELSFISTEGSNPSFLILCLM